MPRSCGPSARAVITPVPTPSTVTTICAPNTPSESRRNRPCPLPSAIVGLHRGRDGGGWLEAIEGVAILAHDRLARIGDEGLPQVGHARLERIAARVECGEIDGHMRHAEAVRHSGERLH